MAKLWHFYVYMQHLLTLIIRDTYGLKCLFLNVQEMVNKIVGTLQKHFFVELLLKISIVESHMTYDEG